FAGSPLPLCSSSSCQVRPPSVVLKKPLPLRDVGLSPPDRKVQPFRRKSHMPAKRTFGSPEFIEIIEQPVDGFGPFRILFQVLPVTTQIVLGDCGSTVIAPMDSTGSLSNTGLNVVPPLVDFQTPPLAAPTYTVSRPFSLTAAIAATRPLIAAEPMFRAPRPE